MATHLVFLLFVALAVYAQNLTGFALALILLGLIGATDLLPLTDAVNTVTVMILATGVTFLHRRWPLQLDRLLWPAVAASVAGAIVGTALLLWLAGTAYEALRLLLGVSIVACALVLWRAARPWEAVSSRGAFALAGALSGLLGGLFAAPGPPLVYLMYRQPMATARVQESLILFFGITALMRLLIVVPAGQFSRDAVLLSAEALPVVFVVTTFAASRPSPLPPTVLKIVVCLLLVGTGAQMIAAALAAMG